MNLDIKAIGTKLSRIDGPQKVTGEAEYAYEHEIDKVAYAHPIQSTIAKGHITGIDTSAASALPGVLLVLTHENAPHITPAEDSFRMSVLQSDRVAYRGQFVAAVVAETLEVAKEAADLVIIKYEERKPDVELRADRPDLYKPKQINPNYETDTESGDVEKALTSARFTLDEVYTTPAYHANALEPHATIADWQEDGLTLYDSNQGAHRIRDTIAEAFGLEPEKVRVISPYIGGAFGSKAHAHPHVSLAVMASKLVGRPVKLAITRQQMFAVVGYRTPTIQHIRLGTDAEGHLTAISHEVVEQTSTLGEFAEQTALATRMMYASPNRLTTHRLARLDVPTPSFFRAPGECPGMFALESAMDEMALVCGLDPVEFRIRNEPEIDPETGNPFSTRNLIKCLQEGAERFGWAERNSKVRQGKDGRWLVGTGVAASTYPARQRASSATARVDPMGQYTVRIDASDLGTGSRTALTQIAADALGAPLECVRVEIGDSNLPSASLAGGSMGTSSWGAAIVETAERLRASLADEFGGFVPPSGIEVPGEVKDNALATKFAMHGYGAQFAEVRVNMDTGEVRVPRMLGVFAVGRVINPKTARSQLLGGMTMGLSMALHEESVIDLHFGDYVNHDLAEYHIATNADVGTIDISWIDEVDTKVNPMGAKGIGEIGIVGAAAAIANAVYHATGIRIRDLPITLDKLL